MKFIFPDVGEGIHEAKIVNILKKVGDSINKDETLCEVETDKSIVEIPSPETGVISEIDFKVGDTIHVGDTLAVIDLGSNTTKDSKESSPVEQEVATKDTGNVVGSLEDADTSKFSDLDFSNYQADSYTKPEINILKSNSRKLEAETNTTVEGASKTEQLSNVRKTISTRMRDSLQFTAQVTHMEDMIIENIYQHRQDTKEQAAQEGVKLTYLPYFIMALIAACKKFPEFNAIYNSQKQELTKSNEFHVAIAVDTPYGLMVPVIKNAENYNLFGLAKEITRIAKKANERSLSVEEQSGSTITITNYGSLGTKYATPILNTPNTINVGLGTLDQKLVIEDDHINSFTIAPISLTYAHDVIDGGQAARFLQSLKQELLNLT